MYNAKCVSDPLVNPSLRWPSPNPTLAPATTHARPVKLSAVAEMSKWCPCSTCRSDSRQNVISYYRRLSNFSACGVEDRPSNINENAFVSVPNVAAGTQQVRLGLNKYFETMFRKIVKSYSLLFCSLLGACDVRDKA